MAKLVCLVLVLATLAVCLAIGGAFWFGLAWLVWGSAASAPVWFWCVTCLFLANGAWRGIRLVVPTTREMADEVEREMAR
jgi:hypothetical protein